MKQVISQVPLRILHLEDEPLDTEIVREMLKADNLDCTVHAVATRPEFERALEEDNWSLILSDFSLPSFDGLEALALARAQAPGVPFILFSGTIGEETAVESLKNGATDYILKHRPARLMSAVRHALEESVERRRHLQAELALRKSEEQNKQLEAQFLRMQRMESLSSLIGGIAHDLNNALAPVLMGIGYLRAEPLGEEETQRTLATIEASARRGAEMLSQVLAFARGADGKKTQVRVNAVLREMERMMKDVFPKSIQSQIKHPADLWPVAGYATQLHQVLMNLCINARDAMPQGGQLMLSAENLSFDNNAAQLYPGAVPGPYVLISVSDTGTGMTAEVLDKIFQPFFTTKRPGEGTGLGLSTSMNIVKNHGGWITVKSDAGKGSEFRVYLPAVVAASAEDVKGRQPNLPTGNGQCILVVDDEASICEIAKATLENYGYEVLLASDGPEAIGLLAEQREKIALAITDTSMPFMDGRATRQALRQINPRLKIIAASGNIPASQNGRHSETAAAFLQKPYTIETLLTTIHAVLSATG